jgi:hypothetical protein
VFLIDNAIQLQEGRVSYGNNAAIPKPIVLTPATITLTHNTAAICRQQLSLREFETKCRKILFELFQSSRIPLALMLRLTHGTDYKLVAPRLVPGAFSATLAVLVVEHRSSRPLPRPGCWRPRDSPAGNPPNRSQRRHCRMVVAHERAVCRSACGRAAGLPMRIGELCIGLVLYPATCAHFVRCHEWTMHHTV